MSIQKEIDAFVAEVEVLLLTASVAEKAAVKEGFERVLALL